MDANHEHGIETISESGDLHTSIAEFNVSNWKLLHYVELINVYCLHKLYRHVARSRN